MSRWQREINKGFPSQNDVLEIPRKKPHWERKNLSHLGCIGNMWQRYFWRYVGRKLETWGPTGLQRTLLHGTRAMPLDHWVAGGKELLFSSSLGQHTHGHLLADGLWTRCPSLQIPAESQKCIIFPPLNSQKELCNSLQTQSCSLLFCNTFGVKSKPLYVGEVEWKDTPPVQISRSSF